MKKTPNEESLRWFTHARDEFLDADELRKRNRYYLALFHFQQATEKAIKAYLYLKVKTSDIFFTHSIDELLKMEETCPGLLSLRSWEGYRRLS